MTSSFNKTKFCNYLTTPSPTGHIESPRGELAAVSDDAIGYQYQELLGQ